MSMPSWFSIDFCNRLMPDTGGKMILRASVENSRNRNIECKITDWNIICMSSVTGFSSAVPKSEKTCKRGQEEANYCLNNGGSEGSKSRYAQVR